MNSQPKRGRTSAPETSITAPAWTLTTVIGFLTVLLFFYAIHWVLLPFIIAGVLGYVCTPLIDRLARYGPRGLMAVAVFLILLGLAAGLAFLGVPALVGEAGQVVANFGGTIERLVRGLIGDRSIELFGQPLNASDVSHAAVTAARNWIGQGGTLLDLATWSFAAVFGFFLTLVLLFYFLIGGKQIGRGLFWLVPPKHRLFAEHIWRRLDPVLKRYFIGVIIVVAYATVAAYIGLGLILGIHHAIFLALTTGILEMLPIVGPAAAIVLSALVAVQQATTTGAIIGYAVYATVLRLSIDQLLGPLVLGQAARLHPTLIIFCFLSGGLLFGIAGVILSVPVALAVRVILTVLYDSSDRPERVTRTQV
jgi:predicted PurR-regulated permease PerM